MGKLDANQYEHLANISAGAPSASDGVAAGFDLGNEWLDTTTNQVYKFVAEPTPGSAVWTDITAGAGGGITPAQHKALRDLIHFIDDGPADGFASGSYKETTYNGVFPTVIDWWEDVTKTQRIVDLTITYTGAFPTTEVWRMYDTDGVTVLVTLTDTITYNGALEATRTRTWV